MVFNEHTIHMNMHIVQEPLAKSLFVQVRFCEIWSDQAAEI